MPPAGEPGPTARLDAALAAIDAANAEDPNTIVHEGVEQPKELLHGRLVTEWVRRLDPDASEPQMLAARAHHFRRWRSPRDEYPAGRAGYLRWRAAAARRQADDVGQVLRRHGYEGDSVERVGAIIRKEGRTRDAAVQTHEDALCLVFLETQLADVAVRLGDDHAREVLVRTLAKMSPRAIEAALALDLPPHAARLLHDAATGDPPEQRER